KHKKERRPSTHHEPTLKERMTEWHDTKAPGFFRAAYTVSSVVVCLTLIGILLITVSFLPVYGNPDNPAHNEVSERYIEKGLEETGSVNIVSGMILDYRAFDTLGESHVLFTASAAVMLLMKKEKKGKEKTDKFSPKRDPIVKNVARFIIPFLMVFGVYLMLNGHLSPGGGFSAGAVMGASLILYSSAFGYKKISKVITEKFVKTVTLCSLLFYAGIKCYSFFTGANHIPTGIPLGTPGAILSSGLILPLNIAVGLVVTCTMYSFYSLFSKGEI
ncbi:MAG: hypothetical protein II977_00410, partial [Oscillospiraceae bacterium]|nr:hypothetical protein [Oscillospiraceae bacterium]